MFFKKSQEQLDAAFLDAVSRHKYKKAKALFKSGADVFAQDTEGNTAIHKLAGGILRRGDCDEGIKGDSLDKAFSLKSRSYSISKIDEFLCFLINQKLDINARNKRGQTCLHLLMLNMDDIGCYEWSDGKKTPIFVPDILLPILVERGADLNVFDRQHETPLFLVKSVFLARKLISRGARVNVQNDEGHTLLHVAAIAGNEDLVSFYLTRDKSLIAVCDNEGEFPHQSALKWGHHKLSQELLAKLNAYNAELAQRQRAAQMPSAPPPPPPPNNTWHLLDSEQIAHVSVQKAIGYKITEIFNFRARVYKQITHNIDTKAQDTVIKSFDEFPDKAFFIEAHKQLKDLDGTADEQLIYGPVVEKKTKAVSAPN